MRQAVNRCRLTDHTVAVPRQGTTSLTPGVEAVGATWATKAVAVASAGFCRPLPYWTALISCLKTWFRRVGSQLHSISTVGQCT